MLFFPGLKFGGWPLTCLTPTGKKYSFFQPSPEIEPLRGTIFFAAFRS
jgi:hypothetical protein